MNGAFILNNETRNIKTVANLMALKTDSVSVPMVKISEIWTPDYEEASCLFGISAVLDYHLQASPHAKSLILETVTCKDLSDFTLLKSHTCPGGSWFLCDNLYLQVWLPSEFLKKLCSSVVPTQVFFKITDVSDSFTLVL
jgi:hypothetical protein